MIHTETPQETALLDAASAGHFKGMVDFGAGNQSRLAKGALGISGWFQRRRIPA